MQCPACQAEARRFGRNRNGSQRYQCRDCRRTFTPEGDRPLGNMRLDAAKAVLCLRMLLEGTSVRSVERLTDVNRNTILSLLVTVGPRCQQFLEQAVQGVPVNHVEIDEIWGFVHCKEKTRLRKGYSEDVGDSYCFTGIKGEPKLMLAWHLGRRTAADAKLFCEKLSCATSGRFQLTSDGFKPYKTTVPLTFGNRVDFAQLIKEYGIPDGEERRYSPPEVVGTTTVVCCGNPDPGRICTSYVERGNLTIRMTIRRLTRLTNAFSKKWANHEAALGLFFAFYNYCRPHMTLNERAGRKTTPAMAAGLTDHVWSVGELLIAAAQSMQS